MSVVKLFVLFKLCGLTTIGWQWIMLFMVLDCIHWDKQDTIYVQEKKY